MSCSASGTFAKSPLYVPFAAFFIIKLHQLLIGVKSILSESVFVVTCQSLAVINYKSLLVENSVDPLCKKGFFLSVWSADSGGALSFLSSCEV